MGFSVSLGPSRRPESREQMIATHNAFLEWALTEDRALPRIPTRRVDRGGFSEMMRLPGARMMAAHWWQTAIDRVRS